jgi:3-oxoacyl-[acyl-carrier-protein] synthase III
MSLGARITGVGRCLPERVLTNAELERMVDTSDEWIAERTGIRERRIASPEETTSVLASGAARAALASAQVDARDIDLIVTGTCTPDGMFPSVSTLVQHEVGATRAGAFDVNAACSGFLSALSTATQFIKAGSAQKALVIGAETLSRIVDWSDRSTCVLFGDGAGALVLERAEPGEPGDVGAVLLRSDGGQAGLLYAPGPCTPPVEGLRQEARIVMDGRGVYRYAVTAMAEASLEAIERAGLQPSDIAMCVPHQANRRIITAVADRLRMPMDRVFVNVDHFGNTSSASIPIALSEASDLGLLHPGDHVLLTAFGGGLSWGAIVLQWSGVRAAAMTEVAPSKAASA